MSQNYKLVVICGLARSGTTYVGRTISKAKGVSLINEPLNKDFGVKSVRQWYPFDVHTKRLIQDILDFRVGWTRSSPPEYPFITRLSKSVYGGRSNLAWIVLRLKKFLGFPLQTICMRDPFMTFMIDHIIRSYNAKAVCMIKHPCSLYVSQKRRGKTEYIKDLYAQRNLLDSYAGDISSDTWKLAVQNNTAGVALLWKIMARAITFQSKDSRDLLIVRHEDLCQDPVEVINGICAHFNIAFNHRMEKYLHKTSRGDKIYAKAGKQHSFKRNSIALKDAWRSVIAPEDEEMIREVIGDDIHLIYKQW